MLCNVYILIFSVCFIQQYHIISLQSHRPLNPFDGFDRFDAFDAFDAFDLELRIQSPLYEEGLSQLWDGPYNMG